MAHAAWRTEDLAQIADRGLTLDEVERQIRLLERPRHPRLERACAAGDGIRVLSETEIDRLTTLQGEACAAGRFRKFVPASGAATRMFQSLLAALGSGQDLARSAIEQQALAGSTEARELLVFADGIRRFAFFDDLASVLLRDGLAIDSLIEKGDLGPILTYLLSEEGLDYAALPKGLLRFHRYASGSRTPFEEHLVEAAAYVNDGQTARLHFTVSPQHREAFVRHLDSVRASYERSYATRFEVGFSLQKPSTDTVAVDLEDRPFRDPGGDLLFRPGGHGALIENLNDLGADLVYIKNIDNVVPDDRKAGTVRAKRALGGVLVETQQQIFHHLECLTGASPSSEDLRYALDFVRHDLCVEPPEAIERGDAVSLRYFLVRKLERPLRVCGMVRNTGETGGGPFWVRGADGAGSLQIVETAEVDAASEEQRAILASASYFNPVDVACALRDRHGRCFDLRRHVDQDAVFVTQKSSGGRLLKALERPGLWNGGMADWNTVFVEVPGNSFDPVKTVNDLLRPEHQAGSA
jgi:hypothetical protein